MRAYEVGDFQDLKEMYDTFEPKGLECGLPPPDDQVRLRWIRYVASDLFSVLATYKGGVVGHCALDLSCSDSCPEYLIFLRKGFQNCGIGTGLSAIMKEVAQEAGCKKVVVTVRTANTRAIKVFKTVGFEFSGKIEANRYMELHLKPAKKSGRKISEK